MSDNAKSLGLGALLVAAVLGLMIVLVKTSGPEATAQPASDVPRGALRPGRPPPREIRVGADPRSGPEGRDFFARRLQARFARKGKRIELQAVGEGRTSLQMSWPTASPDQQQIEQLKTAKPFHGELRGKGFRSLVLKVGPRVVWSTDL